MAGTGKDQHIVLYAILCLLQVSEGVSQGSAQLQAQGLGSMHAKRQTVDVQSAENGAVAI